MISPKFSFVIPVHNGMPYIKECIQSMLDQEYKNFDIIVLENKSDDGTTEYLDSLKNRDFIKIFPSDQLLSIEENWARVIKAPFNEFTMIVGADDCYLPNYLTEIVKLINKYPDASLYRTNVCIIDAQSKIIGKSEIFNKKMSEYDYLLGRLSHTYFETGAGYCFRSKDYISIGGIDCVHALMHPDDVLFMKLTALSYLAVSQKHACCYRVHSKCSSTSSKESVAIDGYNYFLDWIYSLNDKKLNSIVKSYLPTHLEKIKSFFSNEGLAELKKRYADFKINPNDKFIKKYIAHKEKLKRSYKKRRAKLKNFFKKEN